MRKISGLVIFSLICILMACGNDAATTNTAPSKVVAVSTASTTTTVDVTTATLATSNATKTLSPTNSTTTTSSNSISNTATTTSISSNTNTATTANTTTSKASVATPAAEPTLSLIAANSMLKETQQIGNLLIQLTIVPGSENENLIDVTLFDTANNQPVTDATLVQVLSNSTEMDMGLQTLNLKPNGKAGVYESNDLHFTMFGNWKLDLLIKLPAQSDVKASFEFNVVQ